MNRTDWKYLALTFIISGFVAGCTDKGSDAPTPAAPAAGMKPAAAHSAAPASGGLKYTAPSDWVSEQPTSSMRQAQYRLPRAEGDPEDAELVVFYFQGGGGGVQMNIDRWTGQFTKADGSPVSGVAKTSKKESHKIPITIVDVSGTYMAGMGPMLAETKAKPNFRMLAAVAEAPSGPWFFKLTGPAKTVGKWESGYQSFLDTIQ
jgi:hypothetical protein